MAILADKKKKVYDPYKVGGPEERVQSKMNQTILDGAKVLAAASGSKQMHDAFIGANKTAKAPLATTEVLNKFFGKPTDTMKVDTTVQGNKKKIIGIGSGNPGTGVSRPIQRMASDGDRMMTPPATAVVEPSTQDNRWNGSGEGYEFTPGKGMKAEDISNLTRNNSDRFANIDPDIVAASDRAHQIQYMNRIEGKGMIPIDQMQYREPRHFGPASLDNTEKPLKMGWKERTARATNAAENRSRERIAAMVGPGEEAQAASLQADTQMAPLRKDMLIEQYKKYLAEINSPMTAGVSPESAIEKRKRELRESK